MLTQARLGMPLVPDRTLSMTETSHQRAPQTSADSTEAEQGLLEQIVALAAQEREAVCDLPCQLPAGERTQQALRPGLKRARIARIASRSHNRDVNAAGEQLDDVVNHSIVLLQVTTISVQSPVRIKRDEAELGSRGMHLQNLPQQAWLDAIHNHSTCDV
jgi:hypothetical protein